jgi:transposase-like protein
MTTRDIQRQLRELYGVEVSEGLISEVTGSIQDDVRAWQTRPLEELYVVVYLDAMQVAIRDQQVVRKKAVRIIYTTNSVESLHMQVRKTIKTRGHFPNDEAALRLIWLAIMRAKTT